MSFGTADKLRYSIGLAAHNHSDVLERIALPIGKLDHPSLPICELTQCNRKLLIPDSIYEVSNQNFLQRITVLSHATIHVNELITHAFQRIAVSTKTPVSIANDAILICDNFLPVQCRISSVS